MRPEALASRLRRQPFVPIRIHTTDGTAYDVCHPENAMVLRGRVDIAVDRDPTTGVVGRVDFLSLLHIIRVEDNPVVAPPGTNGTIS